MNQRVFAENDSFLWLSRNMLPGESLKSEAGCKTARETASESVMNASVWGPESCSSDVVFLQYLFLQTSSQCDANNSDANSSSSDMLNIILQEDSFSGTGSATSGSMGYRTSASGTSNSGTSEGRTSASRVSGSPTVITMCFNLWLLYRFEVFVQVFFFFFLTEQAMFNISKRSSVL